ncbi:MAG: hypothetical protein R6V10_05095 [bacterium]
MKRGWKKAALFLIMTVLPAAPLFIMSAPQKADEDKKEAGKKAEADSRPEPGFGDSVRKTASLFPENDYQWLTHYMHQLYERYVQARRAFDNGETDLARANLRLMEVYAEKSKHTLPDTLQNQKSFDKEKYVESIDEMKRHSAKIRGNIERGVWKEAPAGKLDPVLQSCVGCHSAYDIPTTFELGTTFNKMPRIIHEIYELYRLAGKILDKCEKQSAPACRRNLRACYRAVMPYINAMPANVPERNQDGEPIEPETFKQTYGKLRRYNRKALQQIEDREKRLKDFSPPPASLKRSCYACHAKTLDIPPPWP